MFATNSLFLLTALLFLTAGKQLLAAPPPDEHYNEQLLVTDLPNHDILTSFNFSIVARASSKDDNEDFSPYRFLPSLLHQLFRQQGLRQLEFSLAQGYWRTPLWGVNPFGAAAPTGASLLALYGDNKLRHDGGRGRNTSPKSGNGEDGIDRRWEGLVHQLNGLFCASLLDIHPQMTAKPEIFPKQRVDANEGTWLYGQLSGETLCSENFLPWRKLLPCKQSGLVGLLEPRQLLSARFHSIAVRAEKSEVPIHADGGNRKNAGNSTPNKMVEWRVELRADTVHFVDVERDKFVTLRTLFGRELTCHCWVADVSEIRIYPTDSLSIFNDDGRKTNKMEVPMVVSSSQPILRNLKEFNWSTTGENGDEGLNDSPFPVLTLNPKTLSHGEVNVHCYAKSESQVRGRLCTLITNPHPYALDSALYTHMVPWQLRVYLHTLKVRCRRLQLNVTTSSSHHQQRDPIGWIEFHSQRRQFQLAKDGKRPLFIELVLNIPPRSQCLLEADYETAFLRIGDYPADANSGVHVPGPTLTFELHTPTVHSSHAERKVEMEQNENAKPIGNGINGRMTLHGEPLLVLLPVPDFSMPFNVICLVCTVIALFYGQVFALTTRIMRPLREDELEQAKKAPTSHSLEGADREVAQSLITRLRCKLAGLWKALRGQTTVINTTTGAESDKRKAE